LTKSGRSIFYNPFSKLQDIADFLAWCPGDLYLNQSQWRASFICSGLAFLKRPAPHLAPGSIVDSDGRTKFNYSLADPSSRDRASLAAI
jgi:hypothetical protein